MREFIPPKTFESIQGHLRDSAARAVDGWEAGDDEEDTLTGHLGATLQTTWSTPFSEAGSEWRWRVRYKKFRGRGPGAFEKSSGADGIFQVEVDSGGVLTYKGLLFQAKKRDSYDHAKLSDQARKMRNLVPNGSAVIEYGPTAFHAVTSEEYLRQVTPQSPAPLRYTELGKFLADRFLECKTGRRSLYYDAGRGVLITPDGEGRVVSIRQRIRVEVQAR